MLSGFYLQIGEGEADSLLSPGKVCPVLPPGNRGVAGSKKMPGAAYAQEIEEGHLMSSHGVIIQVFKIIHFLISFSLLSALNTQGENSDRFLE